MHELLIKKTSLPMKNISLYYKNIILLSVVSIAISGFLLYSPSIVFASSSSLVSIPFQEPLSTSSKEIANATSEDSLSLDTVDEPIFSSSKQINLVGTITSREDPVQVTGLEQSYYIFPVENSSKTYSGILTFTSSKPVQLQSINILTLNNTLKLPIQFGTLYTFPMNDAIIITSDLFDVPKASGSVTFSGNSLRFITNEPFLLTYSFSGQQSQSAVKNDIESGLETYRKLIGTIS